MKLAEPIVRTPSIMPIPSSAETPEVRVRIDSDLAIIEARQRGRALAAQAGFGSTDLTLISTAISELARNALRYAIGGEVIVKLLDVGRGRGVLIEARDRGPGIANIDEALKDGVSTSGSLGLGLPGVRRLMDEFEIRSVVGEGTTIIARKWAPTH